MTPDIYYFAFGMNLDPRAMPTDSVLVGPAHLFGWRLAFRFFATIERCGCAEAYGGCECSDDVYVPGGLWKITPDTLAMLDRREGYPRMYDRIETPVQLPWDECPSAIVYVPTGSYEASRLELPDASYLEMLQRGYRHFGLGPDDYAKLAEALQTAAAVTKRSGLL